MALISCSECGKQVSDLATSCPHCGCPLGTRSRPEPQVVIQQPQASAAGQGFGQGFGCVFGVLLAVVVLAVALIGFNAAAKCKNCNGTGRVLGGLMECPDCKGRGILGK